MYTFKIFKKKVQNTSIYPSPQITTPKSVKIHAEKNHYVMRSTSGYASIWCILLHQLQSRDSINLL